MRIKFVFIPKLLVLFGLFVCIHPNTFAQQIDDFKQLARLSFSNPAQNQVDTCSLKVSSSSIGFIIDFYQHVLEKQDLTPCYFSPSCSEYWGELAANHGLLYTWIVGFDRLTRCSPIHSDNYSEVKNGLMIDPVK